MRKSWQTIVERERTTAIPGINDTCGLKYHLGNYHQGRYLMLHPETAEQPAAIRQAESYRFMLEHLPMTFPEEQEFFGGVELFKTNQLPPEIPEEEYRKTLEYFGSRFRRRTFQAGNDHTAPDFETLIWEGLPGLAARAEAGCRKHGTPAAEAMRIIADAVVNFFRRAAESCADSHPEASARLRNLAGAPPQTFAEGIQLIWLVFVLVEADGRVHNALARIDQYLYGLFRKSALPHDEALDLLCHLWTKVEGMHETTNICIGGVTPDGEDGSNELSLLCLEATKLVHSASTNLSARLHRGTPDRFLYGCIDLITTGIGFPAVFNDENNIPMLEACGISTRDARDYALFGCVEPLIPGRQVAWSDGRFNLPECFLRAVSDLAEYRTPEELRTAFRREMFAEMERYAEEYNSQLAKFSPERYPDPLLSLFTRGCLERGLDVNAGGAEFPRFHGVGMMGLGTVTDSIAAIETLVFEEKRIRPEQLLTALKDDFRHDEELRLTLLNCAPKYGNDEERTNAIAAWVVDLCAETANRFRTLDGGRFLSCMASNVSNIPAGRELGATPDGRHAGEPLSDAASPVGGRDRHGPTAFVNSIVSPDYSGQACTVVNMRFLPDFLKSPAGRDCMATLLRRFVEGGGQEMQFNVTDNKVLLDAVKHPEQYADLIVRVSGFSAFFNNLSSDVQQDIIRRTVHGA